VTDYSLALPDHLDEDAGTIEAKGWLADATVTLSDGRSLSLSFYDPARLAQEVADELDRTGFFAERNLIVVPNVTREQIERAVRELSETDFAGLAAS
jgi:hypothetical protein